MAPATLVGVMLTPELPKRAVLLVVGGPQTGRVLSLPTTGSITLGRLPKATYSFDEPSVSGVHAGIVCSGSRYMLIDENATNGTFINQKRIAEPTQLQDGDRVQLGPVLSLWFAVVSEAEEAAYRAAYESAHRDALTGAFNRRHLDERLAGEVAFAQRHDKPLSVVMVDIDHFKNVNDQHGHLAGDEVLRAVGALLRRESRAEDIVGRYGGEEFLIVIRDTVVSVACSVAERVRFSMTRLRVKHAGGVLSVTASAGVASLACCKEPPTPEGLVQVADQRLYRAKEAGRNRIVGP
jgi:diguanylate cyclase (GGDEF)-like protein